MDFDIVVVASHRRRPLVTEFLCGIPHKVSYTPEYILPEDFKSTEVGLVANHIGPYRCFKGHQDAIRLAEKDAVLVFEDDAVPNKTTWLTEVQNSLSLLDHFDIVSFHGRDYERVLFESVQNVPGFIQPINKTERTWVVAALAYLVGRKSYEKLLACEYNGTPWDILLYWGYHFCLMEKSPFDHCRSEGSLID